jgi:hypothetical protein
MAGLAGLGRIGSSGIGASGIGASGIGASGTDSRDWLCRVGLALRRTLHGRSVGRLALANPTLLQGSSRRSPTPSRLTRSRRSPRARRSSTTSSKCTQRTQCSCRRYRPMVVLRSMLCVCFPVVCCTWRAVSCMRRRYGDVQSPTFLVRNPPLHCGRSHRWPTVATASTVVRCAVPVAVGVRSKRRRISSSRWRRTRSSRTCSKSKTGTRTMPPWQPCNHATMRSANSDSHGHACDTAAVLYRPSFVSAPVSPTDLTGPSRRQYSQYDRASSTSRNLKYTAPVLYGAACTSYVAISVACFAYNGCTD